MDRAEDPGARQERPEDREEEGSDHEEDVPDAEHPALLLDHHRVQERRRREPRHQRRVLDRIPRVVAAPADLLVGPVSAEQLADAERGPGDERPAARRDDPALVRAAGEQRAHREGERNREPDVAEVEQRRVGHHVRVLEARVQAGTVRRRRLHGKRRRHDDDEEREEDRDSADHGDDPGDEIARAAVEQHRRRSVAGQDQQPEEERSLLPAPERGDRVAGRQLAARVLRDVDEREVVADERGEEDDRGDGARDEGADERVAGRDGETAPALPGGNRAGNDRVEREAERGDECSAAQLRQVTSSSWPCTSTGTSSRASPSSRRRRRSGAHP